MQTHKFKKFDLKISKIQKHCLQVCQQVSALRYSRGRQLKWKCFFDCKAKEARK